jgi:putative modified peptide
MNRISKDIAARLVELLSTDDGFRERFTADPREALRELGFETPEADRGKRGRDPILGLENPQGGLASKEKIAANSDMLLASFQGDEEVGFKVCA